MKLTLAPTELIDQLRAWFFPKDRSIYLANGCSLYLPGSYQVGLARIAETTLSASVTSVTLSAISQAFRTLLLVGQARTDRAAETDNINLRFNSDAGANYDQISLNWTTGGTVASVTRAGTSATVAHVEGNTARANNFTAFATYLPGYSLTDREKWFFCSSSGGFGDVSADADLNLADRRGRWRSNAAISSITVIPNAGTNIVIGSVFTLYGML